MRWRKAPGVCSCFYTDDTGSIQRELVTGSRSVLGQGALVEQTTDLASGTRSDTADAKSATSVTELPDGSDPVLAQIGPVVQMLQPLQAGQQRVLTDRVLAQGDDLDGDGVADSTSVRADATVVGFETVTAAAGRFTDAAHLRSVLTLTATGSRSATRLSLITTIDAWYAPAVGRLRSTIVTDFQGTRTTSGSELLAYKVGGRSSDGSTPRLLQVSPAEGGRTSELAEVRLTFDRAMDSDSLTGAGLRITGPGGEQAAILAQSANGQMVTARLASGLPQGDYTVSLGSAATDMLGNRLAATVSMPDARTVLLTPVRWPADRST